MLRKLRDALPPNLSGEDGRRLYWGALVWMLPLEMVAVLVPLAHQVLHFPSLGFTLSVQVLVIVGILWIFVRALRKANKGR